MIDIPLGKALVLVEEEDEVFGNSCQDCFYYQKNVFDNYVCMTSNIACKYDRREDGKNVIFKLVDYEGAK